MFRVVFPPIIRSTHNCIYSIWYLLNRYCYLPLLWKGWNRVECGVGIVLICFGGVVDVSQQPHQNLTSFPLPFAQHFCLQVLPHLSVCMFSLFLVFDYYIWSICCNFSVCVYCLIPQHCDISLFVHWLGHV